MAAKVDSLSWLVTWLGNWTTDPVWNYILTWNSTCFYFGRGFKDMRIIINCNYKFSYICILENWYLFQELFYNSHNSRIAWRESWPIFRNDKRLVSLSIETKLERRALQPSISNATLAKRRFLEFTNRANRPLFSNDRCSSPDNIFQPTSRSLPFPTKYTRFTTRVFFLFFSLVSRNRGRSIHAHQLFRDARLTAAFNLLCGQPISCRWERMDDARSQRLTIRVSATRVISAPRFGSVNLDPFPRFGIQGILTQEKDEESEFVETVAI